MKLLLNNMLKGLATALLVILLGGFLYVNVVKTEDVNLKLISSSYVNQIKTSTENKNEKETENATNEIIDNSLEEENLKLEVLVHLVKKKLPKKKQKKFLKKKVKM